MQKIFLFLFVLIAMNAGAQKPKFMYQGFEEEMDLAKLSKWEASNAKTYSGIYDFGESEGEWELLVIVLDSSVVLQAKNHSWGSTDKRKDDAWISSFRTFHDVKIEGNKFSSDSLQGYFIKHDKYPGIILPANGNKFDTVEYGSKSKGSLADYFYGDYPSMSYKILDDNFFSGRTKEQLQIMRNEVFARYGMRFTKNGKMYKYFTGKDWYNPWRNNVQDCVTEIEIKNLQRLAKFETGQ